MMFKLPVIGAKSGSTIEILDNDGLLYELGDSKKLADKIEYLIRNPQKEFNYGKKDTKRQ